MIWIVARKEFTEIRRDGRFVWAGLIIFVLLIVAIASGAQRYSEDRNLRLAAEREDRISWLSQGKKNPHSAGHYGVYAFKPATPLALFDPGYDDYTGVLQYLEAHKENQSGYKPAADATALQRFGSLSGARVLQILLPLLIFLLCFGMIAIEREEGTFRQLLSVGVPQPTLVLGKALGVMLAIGTVLLPSILVGGGAAWLISGQGDPHEMAGFSIKLAMLACCYLMFFGTLICLALTVSLISRSSAAALVTLIGFWIFAAILVPRIGSDVAKWMVPTPSIFELTASIAKDQDKGPHAHEPEHPNHIAFRNRLLKQYGVSRPEDLPFNFTGYAMQQEEEFGFRVFDRNFGALRRDFERQDAIQDGFALLSPFIAIKALSAALSGTDVAFSSDFSAAGEAYRRGMIRVLNDDVMKNAVGLNAYSTEWGYQADKSLWKKIPPFDFDPPVVSTILSRNLAALGFLAAWFAGSLLLLRGVARRRAMAA